MTQHLADKNSCHMLSCSCGEIAAIPIMQADVELHWCCSCGLRRSAHIIQNSVLELDGLKRPLRCAIGHKAPPLIEQDLSP